MTAIPMKNGRARKSLADQLDRLDTILDGLADALNDAVRDAVVVAVRTAIREAMAHPELVERLQEKPRAEALVPNEKMSALEKLVAKARRVAAAAAATA